MFESVLPFFSSDIRGRRDYGRLHILYVRADSRILLGWERSYTQGRTAI